LDLASTIGRVRGMLLRPEPTLTAHGRPAPPWTVAMREHVLPLLAVSALVSFVLLLLFPLPLPAGATLDPGMMALTMLVRIVVNLLLVMLMAGIVAFYSAIFGGVARFDAAYVLVALAMTPFFVTEALLPLPGIGRLIALAGVVYALTILYRGLPIVLALPYKNRGKHFLLTLLSMFVIGMLAGLLLGPNLVPMG